MAGSGGAPAFDGPKNTDQDASLSLAIVGGGIGGLCLAISTATHAPHIPVTLYEAAHKFGEIGAGVYFGPNAVRAMSKISPKVVEGFDKVRTANLNKDDIYFTFHVGMDGDEEAQKRGVEDGNVVAEHYFDKSVDSLARGPVYRAAYLDEMVKLVPDAVKIEFGKRLVDVKDEGSNGVLLKFADGTEARHAAVVGCDGIKSKTRILLLGQDDPAAHAVFTGKYCYRGLIPMDQAIEAIGEDRAADSCMYFGYHGHMLTFPVQKGKTMNVVAFTSTEKWDSDQWVVHAEREKMYKDYEGWGATVQQILKIMQKPDIWALFNHLPAKTYYRGRMCVSGDAAHATTPHQGSGAGMAVEDAYVLSKVLQNVKQASEIEAAFAAFDKVRRPRTQRLVTTSKDCGMVFDFETQECGDDVAKIRENLLKRMDWIWYKDIDEDVEQAIRDFGEFKS